MHEDPQEAAAAPGIVNAFLLRYFEDQESGTIEPLDRYQALFPGYESLIAQEYERLKTPREAPNTNSLEDSTATGNVSDLPREVIGPYKLASVLGKGGMGIVYLAEQTEPIQRRVALKLIKIGMDTSEVLARFQTERQALALMNHRNIAKVFDAGTTPKGRPYFVMEYVSGIPINEYCDNHKLDTQERLNLLVQICDGIQHAHQKGIIHRDLKPSNVLVTIEDGQPIPKIIDFGVAKSVNQRLSSGTLFTEQGQILGTPEYMSPEQAEMSALDLDTRTDIYSLGVLLYELLVGALPLDSATLRKAGYAALQRHIVETEPPKPSTKLRSLGDNSTVTARKRGTNLRTLLRDLEGDLDWITMKAMEKLPSRRYDSASELAADIQRHLSHEPVLAGPPGIVYRAKKFLRKRRLSIAACLTLIVIALSTYFITETKHRAERKAASQRSFHEALESRQVFHNLQGRLDTLELDWQSAREKYPYFLPVWESDELLAVRDRKEKTRTELYDAFNRTTLLLHRAVEEVPTGSDTLSYRRTLEDLYWELYQEALRAGGLNIPPTFFKGLMDTVGLGTYEELMGRVHVRSRPHGASVYCFRYESHDGHLFPIPFDPNAGRNDLAKGRLGEPFLEIEKVWLEGFHPFQVGDRWLEVNGVTVSGRGDLTAALEDVDWEEQVNVRIRRGEKERKESWAPFQSTLIAASETEYTHSVHGKNPTRQPIKAGTVLDIRYQFGFQFKGYPLEFHPESRLGTTRPDGDLEVALPPGSYLLVFRLDNHVDVRYPIAVPRPNEDIDVLLLRPEHIPAGFVYVPAGSFNYGGDSHEAVDSLIPGRRHLKGFLMARHEVSAREYLEFLNDPEITASIDTNGDCSPRARWEHVPSLGKYSEIPESKRRVAVIPRSRSGRFKLLRDKDRTWKSPRPDHPIYNVTVFAALEYVHWLRSQKAEKWRFRLPSDFEWEKAARGDDRRTHVWGNDAFPSQCNTKIGCLLDRAVLAPTESFPLDESVYGIRGLAGSVFEATSDTTSPDGEYISRRGGHWLADDGFEFRIATRSGRPPAGRGDDMGIRVVTDLPEGAETP